MASQCDSERLFVMAMRQVRFEETGEHETCNREGKIFKAKNRDFNGGNSPVNPCATARN